MSSRKDYETIRKEVVSLLRNHGTKAFRIKEIAKKLGYTDNVVYRRYLEVIGDLDEAASVTRVKGGRYQYRKPGGTAIGRLTVHPKGFGFVAVEGSSQDFFVKGSDLKTALDGDTVRISSAAGTRGGRRREAEIVEVIERGRTEAVGTFRQRGRFGIVVPDDRRLTRDIYVDAEDSASAQDGDKVLVSIERFEDPHGAPEGRVLQVIGRADDPNVQVLSLAVGLGVRPEFPDAVEKELEPLPKKILKRHLRGRLDLREKRTFTIDPEDAKDFDDAIHIMAMNDGSYEVGVHIADVSHFVPVDSATDSEAFSRGTSVYLVDRVIPMLPERLSNELCSLKPDVDRLTFSCIMHVDESGTVHQYDLRQTVIRSRSRLTYGQAQAIIDKSDRDHPMAEDILVAHRLAQRLTERRMEAGSIDFDVPEIKVVLDEQSRPIEMIVKPREASNRLVEEFMLLANRVVAEHAARSEAKETFVYRVHDAPDLEKIRNLAHYVGAFGYRLSIRDGTVDSRSLNNLLRAVDGRPEAPVIEEAALRAMAKAIYSTDNIGHYGLGFETYTHFTSPIRRYPDLVVHRLLKGLAAGQLSIARDRLEEICSHSSERERAAEEAERESVKLKQVEYARNHLGDHFNGVVSGVTKFGVFVEITDLLVEGMVHVRDMDDDHYEYDEKSFSLRGIYTGKMYQPGQPVRVIIVAADVDTREIDLYFADA